MNKIIKEFTLSAIVLVFAFLSLPNLEAQRPAPFNGEVSGRILDDSNREAVGFATVSVIEVESGELKTGGISEMNGNFFIERIPAGEYKLRINYIGYEAYETSSFVLNPANSSAFFQTIRLIPASQELDEVVVSEQRSSFETRIDRRIFNVENDIVTDGGTALEVLSNVPSVEVDLDDNISLRGDDNVTILIDGRPSTFSSAEVLRQIPGNSIERIELITNPSARFDPEGMAGIINIILKRDSNFGFNGNATLSYGRGKTDKYSGSLGLNMRNSNFNIFGNYSYNNRDGYSEGTGSSFINFPDTSYSLRQKDVGYTGNISHNIRLGTDYFLNSRNTLYTSFNYRTSDNNNNNELLIDYFDQIGSKEIESIRRNTGFGSGDGLEINAGWQRRFLNPENRMDIDFLYSRDNRDRGNDFAQDFFKLNGEVFDDPLIQSQERDNKNELFTGRADFEFILLPGISAETGARMDLSRIDNKLNSTFLDNSTGENINDPNISNHFVYEQDVLATYFTAGGESGPWQYKAGLRAEQTFTSSKLITTGEEFDNDYFSLFPSAFLGYSLGEGSDLVLSYSRRINRPRTGQLNPFRDLSDPNNFRTGNPALRPEFTDAFEFSYIRIWDKITLNNTLYYRQTNDLIRRFIDFEEEGTTIVTFENLGRNHSFGFEAIANIRPYRWWNINATANIFGTRLDESELTQGLNRSSQGYTLQLSSSKTVWNGTSVQLSSRYRSGFIVPQGEIKPFFNVDFAVRRNFLDNNLTVSLNARDIFNTLRFRFETVDDIPIVRTLERNWESRVVTLNATYRFGSRLDGPQRRQQRRDNDFDRFDTPDF